MNNRDAVALAERLEGRADSLRALARLVRSEPSLIDELRRVLDGGDAPAKPRDPEPQRETTSKGKRSSILDAISEFFERTGGEWATTTEISDATGAKINSVQHVMTHAHREKFESRPNPDGRGNQYRPKEIDVLGELARGYAEVRLQ